MSIFRLEIGVGLAGFGIAFLFLGVLLLFDKGLLAIGNVWQFVVIRVCLYFALCQQTPVKRFNFYSSGFIWSCFRFYLYAGWRVLLAWSERLGFLCSVKRLNHRWHFSAALLLYYWDGQWLACALNPMDFSYCSGESSFRWTLHVINKFVNKFNFFLNIFQFFLSVVFFQLRSIFCGECRFWADCSTFPASVWWVRALLQFVLTDSKFAFELSIVEQIAFGLILIIYHFPYRWLIN